MFTKVASVYPIWLAPLPRYGLPGEWINLANTESLIFDSVNGRYLLRWTSGAYRHLHPEQAKRISAEFKKITNTGAPKTRIKRIKQPT